MIVLLKKLLPSRIFNPLFCYYKRKKLFIARKTWVEEGAPLPPSHVVKQYHIYKAAKKSCIKTFIESGTYKGDMLNAVQPLFSKLYSIELDPALFIKASERFEANKQIHLYQGDSGTVLPEILQNINEPAIFWLDGHFSGGITAKGQKTTPILAELECISKRVLKDIIMIDDARLFNGEDDYPEMAHLMKFIAQHFQHADISINDDIITVRT